MKLASSVVGLVCAVWVVQAVHASSNLSAVVEKVDELRVDDLRVHEAVAQPPAHRLCMDAYFANLRRSRELSDDPEILRECSRVLRLALSACLRGDEQPPSLATLDFSLDELVAIGHACLRHQLLCEELGEESVHCLIWRACVDGEVERVQMEAERELARIAAKDTMIDLGEDTYFMTPSSPKMRLKVRIGAALPKGDLRIAIDAAEGGGDGNGPLAGFRTVAMLYGVTPGEYEIDLRIPVEATDGHSTVLYVVLTDSNGEPAMANSAFVMIGWHEGDFNRDGKTDAQDVIDAVRALGEGRISREEFEQIREAVLRRAE